MGDRRRDARLAHAVGIPRLHPPIEGGVRRRQTYVRRESIGLVQRPHRVLPRLRTAGARPGHGLDGAPPLRRWAVRVLGRRRRRRRHRSHQRRLRSPRAACAGNRARALRRARRAAEAPRRQLRMTSLRIAHIPPVATTIPPPKSGSVETMTSLLTEGLVARGHDVTLFATADSTTKARLAAIYPHGYWHDQNMWPWELCE